mgnify:CR=1 FL=1
MKNQRRIDPDDIKRAIREKGGAASAPEIAAHIHRSTQATRTNLSAMVESGQLVELGFSSTGARCYGVNIMSDCQDHRPVQHRDGKPPWCKTCGLTAYGVEPVGLFDRERRR